MHFKIRKTYEPTYLESLVLHLPMIQYASRLSSGDKMKSYIPRLFTDVSLSSGQGQLCLHLLSHFFFAAFIGRKLCLLLFVWHTTDLYFYQFISLSTSHARSIYISYYTREIYKKRLHVIFCVEASKCVKHLLVENKQNTLAVLRALIFNFLRQGVVSWLIQLWSVWEHTKMYFNYIKLLRWCGGWLSNP